MAEPSNEDLNLIVATALSLTDGKTCFVGIGVPSLAAMLATSSPSTPNGVAKDCRLRVRRKGTASRGARAHLRSKSTRKSS